MCRQAVLLDCVNQIAYVRYLLRSRFVKQLSMLVEVESLNTVHKVVQKIGLKMFKLGG